MEERLRKLFFMPLSESDIHHSFAEAILAGRPDSGRQPEIIIGLQPFVDSPHAKVRPPWESNPRFSHFVTQEAMQEKQMQTESAATNIKQALKEVVSEESALQMVQDAFSRKLESMMQLAPNSVNVNVPLIDLGCDSLLAIEIRGWFLKELQMDVPVLKVLSGDTVAQLCHDATKKYLASRLQTAQKETAPDFRKAEDIVTDKSGLIPSATVNQASQSVNDVGERDTEDDTSSSVDDSLKSSLMRSMQSSTQLPLDGVETPDSLPTPMPTDVDSNPLDDAIDKSIKHTQPASYASISALVSNKVPPMIRQLTM
ncbi:hypothetical protein VTN77DRAFT_9273 [Rasamsonia byssochlamydoides]|uniref:uncharacterized protein n=1 Tax=Rasamsonia byssochlamydoides TaxID=89139 RepID=UPI003742B705